MLIHQDFTLTLQPEALFTNLHEAFNPSLKILSEGFTNGRSTSISYALLKNSLRFVSGEISVEQAALDTVQEVASGALSESASSLVLMSIAAACPPIAIGLAAISPAVSTMDNIAMVKQFFDLLSQYQPEIRRYYKSRSQTEISSLREAEELMMLEVGGKQLFFMRRRLQLDQEIFGWLD